MIAEPVEWANVLASARALPHRGLHHLDELTERGQTLYRLLRQRLFALAIPSVIALAVLAGALTGVGLATPGMGQLPGPAGAAAAGPRRPAGPVTAVPAVPDVVPGPARATLGRPTGWQPLPLEAGPVSDLGTWLRDRLPRLRLVPLPPGIDPAVRGRLQPRRRLV